MTPVPPPIQHLRCPKCKNLLLKVRLSPGSWVQVKCPKCNQMVERKAA